MKIYGFNLRGAWLLALTTIALGCFANTADKTPKRHPLIPNFVVMQHAGNIAKHALGFGWEYGHDRWSTEILFGYVPKFNTCHKKFTITAKQTYTPWMLHIASPLGKGDRLSISPLTCGLYVNTVVGSKQFWSVEPKHIYGGGYYRFSTRIRFGVTFGQELNYDFPTAQRKLGEGIDLYYEFSVCDLSLISAIPNYRLNLAEILSLGLGARWKF